MDGAPQIDRRQWHSTRRVIESISIVALVVISFWNISIFRSSVFTLPAPESNELVVQEERYKQIRIILAKAGHTKGTVAFITNRDLIPGERKEEDDFRWGQGQYVMVPWILVRNGRTVPGVPITGAAPEFIIADFWDGMPASYPKGFETLYDSGSGLVLLRRNAP